MRTIFTDEAPVAEPMPCGLVYLRFKDDKHPTVTTPLHVMRAFCETTTRRLDAWEREQEARCAVVPMGKRPGHG